MSYFEKYHNSGTPYYKDDDVEFIFINGKYMRYCRESEDIIKNRLTILDKDASSLDTLTDIYDFAEVDFIEENCKEVSNFMKTRLTSIEDISDVYLYASNFGIDTNINITVKEVHNGNEMG